MKTTQRLALCHPNRPARAHNLCQSCYAKAWRKGLYPHRRDWESIQLRTLPPGIAGVTQVSFTEWPETCPKCHNPRLTHRDREAYCSGAVGGCGWTGYLVSHEIETVEPVKRGRYAVRA